jgi:hypothetical protein
VPLERPIEVPLIVRLMLKEPYQPARIDVDRERRVRVETVVGDVPFIGRIAKRAGVVGLRGPEEREVERPIVAGRYPYRGAIPFLERQTVPRVTSRLPWSRDRREPPRFPSGLRIERDDEVAAGGATGGANHHLAIRDERPAGHAVTTLVVGYRLIPHDVTALRVERNHVRVGRRHVQSSAIQRDPPLHRGIETARQPS